MRHSGTILGTKPKHNSTQRQTETTDNGLPLSINVEGTGIHVYGGGVKRKKKKNVYGNHKATPDKDGRHLRIDHHNKQF